MQGYGDPYSGGAGYGDPLTSTKRNRGYGSPYDDIFGFLSLETRTVHHKGGGEIIVSGALLPVSGPYRISVLVNGSDQFLYSGLAGAGYDLTLNRGRLIAYTYPMTAGSYQMTLHYGASFAQRTILSESLRVVPDNRALERYQSRRLWPAHYKTGSRFNDMEPLDLAENIFEAGPLAVIADTWGRLMQGINGAPSTVVSSNHLRGANTLSVESVYQFPPQGWLWINKKGYEYQINGSQMDLESPLIENIARGTRVTYYEH